MTVYLENALQFFRDLLESVVYRNIVKGEYPLKFFDGIVNVNDSVMRYLLAYPVKQGSFWIALVV